MKGATIIVKSLEELGVRHVFGYTGSRSEEHTYELQSPKTISNGVHRL